MKTLGLPIALAALMLSTSAATNRFAEHMEAWIPVDVVYRRLLPWDATVTFSILNVFDRDPPPMRQDFAYNTYTANPLGRVFRIGFGKTF